MDSSFQILGLLPSLVERLSEDQIRIVAKEMGNKALQSVFHEDVPETGSRIRAAMINGAVSELTRSTRLQELKEEYIRSGPGQKEILEAEEKYYRILSGIAELIDRTQTSKTKAGELNAGTLRGVVSEQWLFALFSETADISGGLELQLGLRHAPGTRFRIMPPLIPGEIYDAKDRLEELDEVIKGDDGMRRDRMRVNRQVIRELKEQLEADDFESTEDREAAQKNLQQLEHALEYDEAFVEGKKEERMFVKKRLKDAKRKALTGQIDKNGNIMLNGKHTGLRFAGSSDLIAIERASEIGAFVPGLVAGSQMIGVNDNGVFTSLGAITWFSRNERLAKWPRDRPKKRKPETVLETPVKAPEKKQPGPTMLGRYTGLHVEYEKNPFETLGLMPSLVGELSEENLRKVVAVLGKTLLKVLHPDTGGDAVHFAEVNAALTLLEQEDLFKRARLEYVLSQPSAGKIAAIQKLVDAKRSESETVSLEYAKARMTLVKAEDRLQQRKKEETQFIRYAIAGLFSQDLGPRMDEHPGAVYLYKAANAVLSVLMEDRTESYHVTISGYDVFGTAQSSGERFRLRGSTHPSSLTGFERARAFTAKFNDDKTPPYLRYGTEQIMLALHPNGFLFGIDENDALRLLGKIEKIDVDKGTAVARKMAAGLKSSARATRTGTKV